MIDINELKRIAAKNKVGLSIIEKDYALTWMLYALSTTEFNKYFIFKGGTALRKIYFPDWRYSEDLDFTLSKKLSENELKLIIKEINDYLSKNTGIVLNIKSLHINPEYAQMKIQFIGPLNNKNTIKIDISFNEIIVLPPKNEQILSEYSDKEKHLLQVYPLEEILAEKIRSILQRGKTRDYYDVWKLLKLHSDKLDKLKTKEVILKKCQFKNIDFRKELLFSKDRINSTNEYWKKGLAHQIDALPDFNEVVLECKDLVNKFLDE